MINLSSIKSNIITKKKILLNQNNEDGILGLGWSHPSYGRNLRNIGVWSEGYYSSFIFNTKKMTLKFKFIFKISFDQQKKHSIKDNNIY